MIKILNLMFSNKCVLVLCAFLFVLSAEAQLKRPGYSQHYSDGLRYGLFKPVNYDPKKNYPLIVYLHGSRDTVSRDLFWYQDVVQKAHPCFVLTPKCEESNLGWGDTWHEGHPAATIKTLHLIDSL